MADYYAIPTHIGEAKLANALALGEPLQITHLAVGDGEGQGAQGTPLPDPAQTTLRSERRRAPINTLSTDPTNPNVLVAEQVIPEDVGGWWIRELGLFDADGDMIAVCNTPPTYKPVLASGSGRTQVVRMQLIVTDTAAVTLRVDPAVVLATRKYVDDQRQAHEESRDHPAATTTEQGMVMLASDAIAQAMTSRAHALTPANLAALAATQDRAGLVRLADITSTLVARLRGIPFPFPGEVPPPGAIAYDGAELQRADFPELWEWAQQYAAIVTDAEWHADMWGAFSSGDGVTTFRVPDLRGEVIRGWDAGRGVDPGRALGSLQLDAMQNVTGEFGIMRGSGNFNTGPFFTARAHNDASGGYAGHIVGFDLSLAARTADETRQRNIAYNYCAFY